MRRGIPGRGGTEDRSFTVQTESSEAVERVRLLGEMDLSVVDRLDSEMRRAEATERGRSSSIWIELDFLDASGIRLLLALDRRSRSNGGRLRITGRQARRRCGACSS